ncbi:hypothetical protein K0U27_00675 [archaeon]|nr:hypothetical protein [archaeon]
MSDNKIFTYWPKNGSLYAGDKSNIDLSQHDPTTAKLGSIRKVGKEFVAKMNPSLNRAYAAHKSYNAAINDTSIDHINAFTLSSELVGVPDEWFSLEAMTREINVSSLNQRIPERDAFKAQLGVKPLEEVDFTQVKYGEDHFDLTYNAAPFFHPSEDLLKGVLDPMNVDLSESQRALREARDGLALLELTKLTAGTDLKDMELKNTGGSHVNNPKREIVGKIRQHWKATQTRINWTAWNPVDFERYESNTHIENGDVKHDAAMQGVVPLPKVPGVMAAVDPLVPLGNVYFVSSQAFLKGVGPMQTEQWRRPENNADLGIVRDYVQFLLMNPARYGFKAEIDLTTSGDTVETEPSTLRDIRELVGNPSVAVNAPKIG